MIKVRMVKYDDHTYNGIMGNEPFVFELKDNMTYWRINIGDIEGSNEDSYGSPYHGSGDEASAKRLIELSAKSHFGQSEDIKFGEITFEEWVNARWQYETLMGYLAGYYLGEISFDKLVDKLSAIRISPERD